MSVFYSYENMYLDVHHFHFIHGKGFQTVWLGLLENFMFLPDIHIVMTSHEKF